MADSMASMNDSYQSMVSYDSGPVMNDSYVSLANESNGVTMSDRLADTLGDSMELSSASIPTAEPEAEPSQVFYPPQSIKIVGERDGIHYFEDGHFWTEVISLLNYNCIFFYRSVFVKSHLKVAYLNCLNKDFLYKEYNYFV